MSTFIVYAVKPGIGRQNLTSTHDKMYAEHLVEEYSLSLGSGARVFYRSIAVSKRGTRKMH